MSIKASLQSAIRARSTKRLLIIGVCLLVLVAVAGFTVRYFANRYSQQINTTYSDEPTEEGLRKAREYTSIRVVYAGTITNIDEATKQIELSTDTGLRVLKYDDTSHFVRGKAYTKIPVADLPRDRVISVVYNTASERIVEIML